MVGYSMKWVGGPFIYTRVIDTNMRNHRCIITFPRHNPNITFPTIVGYLRRDTSMWIYSFCMKDYVYAFFV